uniref:Kazal-like domain-containing protein n=1 Tax=Castor canadensis TaxID=51338 RepID=A0A8C0WB18_CASCN
INQLQRNKMPLKCPDVFKPICGLDGITYSSECILCKENMEREYPVLVRAAGSCKS